MSSKIVIAGGTGALGSLLVGAFSGAYREVIVLSRSVSGVSGAIRYIRWDGRTLGDWADELEGAAAVINLAGKSIHIRFTAKNRREISESRVLSTTIIGDAIRRCNEPPKVWINAGGISIYEPSPLLRTEHDIPSGTDFLASVSRAWEAAFLNAEVPVTRKVLLRISPVLLSSGGMLAPLVRLAGFGLGGAIGSGRQYVSWIHERDFVKMVEWLISEGAIAGVVHASSPNPVQNGDFMRILREKLGVPIGLPNPAWSVKLGAWIIGTDAGLVLSGRRVVSRVSADAGFQFDFPELDAALHNLIV
ncbi:hypothetical protein SAMN05421747_11123 [Parapedobacter composti]|uniref:TIGR01777 family protein n=1 Tax=Parapedobacter composti TaxID=623281 RepID=A0A1I1J5D6_9SPHI|nr:TIGR01777 family oxidoreductase [Parapedobacter composti]SFC43676.1 hypothetical protein SAMN05421747_11123 [Parapedobacter composti]